MRLTDEVLKRSADCTAEQIGTALMLSASGRFGLMPCTRDFDLQVDINNGYIEVAALDCLGLTKAGDVIDIHCDTQFSNSYETRVQLPLSPEKVLFLTVEAHPQQWHDAADGYELPAYSFALVPDSTPISEHSLPIGRLVNENEYGWHLDDIDFVPPCLLVSSHKAFVEQWRQFVHALGELDRELTARLQSDGRNVMCILWPEVRRLMIVADKERDTLTPMQLLGCVQRVVSAFAVAVELDDHLDLSETDRETFSRYVLSPYNYKDVYQKIRDGLALNMTICEKMSHLEAMPMPEPPRSNQPKSPTIAEKQLTQKCTDTKTRVIITNNAPGATVYYTTDGSEPSTTSPKGTVINIANGFRDDPKPEPDRTTTVKVMAALNGICSRVNTYEITFHKMSGKWWKYEI